MDKYIFLDIDGVIATPASIENGFWGLTDQCQNFLGEILNNTGSKLVISSSWRENTVEKTQRKLSENNFRYSEYIVGVTIRAYKYIEKGIHLSIPRGVEIKQWIDCNIHSNNGKNFIKKKNGVDFAYLILDDDNDFLLEQKNNFIRTNSTIGLSKNDVIKSIKILNKKYN